MKALLKRFMSDDKGLETVEYAVIAALITLAAVVAISSLGSAVAAKLSELASKLQ